LSKPQFIVRIADLERGKKQYEWELPLPWLRHAFEGTEATLEAPGSLAFEASITSRQVLIRGKAQASVTVPCARTLDPVPLDLMADIFLVFRPAATTHDGNRAATGSVAKKTSHATEPQKAATAPKGKRAHRPDGELSEDDAAEDLYKGDHIELDEPVREFLLLELPMKPIRSDLRYSERPAIPPTPETPVGSESSMTVDPRLRPLAEIASRLRNTTKE
jgi:uncharacterized metal-binding protein YceD (DUF177 family)